MRREGENKAMNKTDYFNNTKSQYRRKKDFPSMVFFDIESDGRNGGKEAIQETWSELKEKLGNNEINYYDLDEVKKVRFIEVLNGLLENEQMKKNVTCDLKYYARSKKFLRAAIIGPNENTIKDRFIPIADKIKSSNRFSPKGIEWLYLGFDRYMSDAKKCCLAEVRAKKDSNVKFCEFKHNKDSHKVIDLTKADNMDWDEICTKRVETPEKATVTFVSQVYCKLLSEEIFLPVNSVDKDAEYAPFHCMAQYFKSLGYDGIIYKSTVSAVGKNIVMFDKESFSPTQLL